MPRDVRRTVQRYLLHPGEQKSIAPVLFVTLLALALAPLLSAARWGGVFAIALIGGSAYMALVRTGAHGAFRRIAETIVIAGTLAAIVTPVLDEQRTDEIFRVVSNVLFVILLLITPMIVLIRLLLRPKITLDTVAGALAAYLQIGLFFGALYQLVAIVSSDPFFVGNPKVVGFDYMYFSFITITTTGYGDFTPATTVGQTMAVMEAIIGQLFLVTVVALVVSNLGREVPRRRSIHGEDVAEEDGPEDDVMDDDGDAAEPVS
ncbi:MAG: potassium channel family protein [Microthrixaceae bacterium]